MVSNLYCIESSRPHHAYYYEKYASFLDAWMTLSSCSWSPQRCYDSMKTSNLKQNVKVMDGICTLPMQMSNVVAYCDFRRLEEFGAWTASSSSSVYLLFLRFPRHSRSSFRRDGNDESLFFSADRV